MTESARPAATAERTAPAASTGTAAPTGPAEGPAGVRRFPWYDSFWLRAFHEVSDHLERHHPDRLPEFLDATAVLRTDPGFRERRVDLFSPELHRRMVDRSGELFAGAVEEEERRAFGRGIVRDDPFFTRVQRSLTDRVGEIVGEPVRPVYNFLADYGPRGICRLHLDSPEAKWTVDHCLEANVDWPLSVSRVVDWPDGLSEPGGWPDRIIGDPAHAFEHHVLRESDTMVFAGSSQWHVRDRITPSTVSPRCRLVFFHFAPAGTEALVDLSCWASRFDLPCLADLPEIRRYCGS